VTSDNGLIAFAYPPAPRDRRHGPAGYSDLASYRPWLRDEFSFRCAYCLIREQWGRVRGEFDLDHFVPQVANPGLRLDYENLVYACRVCNARKAAKRIPDVCEAMTSGAVRVSQSGALVTSTAEAEQVVRDLRLNSSHFIHWRRLWIRIIGLAAKHDAEHYRQLMSYPDDLPNLAALRPPRNARPSGIERSHFARRRRGELGETYEC
jgi:hypothetical protein